MTRTLSWETVLADLDSRIELAEQALEDGVELDASLLTPWVPPEGLGPMPVALLERARTVLARQSELEQRLDTVMGQLSREVAKSNHENRKMSAYGESVIPKFFDSAV